MVIATNLEYMNKGLTYLLPSKIFLTISVSIWVILSAFDNSPFQMLDYVYLQTLTSSIKSIYNANLIYVVQWDKGTEYINIINIERSYANRILQESMDRIIKISWKRKNSESFFNKHLNLRSDLYFFKLFCYIVLRRLVQ